MVSPVRNWCVLLDLVDSMTEVAGCLALILVEIEAKASMRVGAVCHSMRGCYSMLQLMAEKAAWKNLA